MTTAPLSMLRAFVALARLKFLAGGFAGFGAGAAIAAYERAAVAPAPYLLGQAAVTAFHLMVHFANDYYDRASDARTVRTPFSGGSGVLVEGRLPPQAALYAALACAATGLVATAALFAAGRSAAGWLALAIAAGAWSYSAPPLRLLARGLGELDAVLVVAVLVPLTGYAVFAGVPDERAILATLPPAAAMFAMMLCVEFPDYAADSATGKRNLVVRAGYAGGRVLVDLVLVLLYVAVLAALEFGAPWTLGAFAVLGVPLAVGLSQALERGGFGAPRVDAELAARGVALFLATMLGVALAYACARPPAGSTRALSGTETTVLLDRFYGRFSGGNDVNERSSPYVR